MMETPFDRATVEAVIADFNITDFNNATIRQVAAVAAELEKRTGKRFIHMEIGVPGFPPAHVGVEAEIEAIRAGVGSVYPPIDGIPALKNEASRFIKAFINLDVKPEGCVPTVGSMQGTFAAFMICGQIDPKKDTILYVDPGFSVQKLQTHVMGYKSASFDVYEYRGERLREKIESYFSAGNIAGIVYSNPNNPAWICLTDSELKIIGELCEKYDVILLEDLAYMTMDFRRDLSRPFEPPYQVSAARYCKNYILFMSASKIFSYAGQRIAVAAVSDSLYHRVYPELERRYGHSLAEFGRAFVNMFLYTLSSGTTHSAQYALAAMYKAACDGSFDFVEIIREYGRRAERLKAIFTQYGFTIPYDKDMDENVSDGFFFTIGYPGMSCGELMKELMYYGVSAMSLATCGSEQQGLRACTSNIKEEEYAELESRLKVFKANH